MVLSDPKGSEVTNNQDPDQASMVVFPDTLYTYRHSGRFKTDNFFLISNFCHSIQLIQIPGLRVRIQRGDKGSRPGHPLEKQKLYGFLYVISNWTPSLEKSCTPDPWKKCWTPSGTSGNY